jgi:hypothetical protein
VWPAPPGLTHRLKESIERLRDVSPYLKREVEDYLSSLPEIDSFVILAFRQ